MPEDSTQQTSERPKLKVLFHPKDHPWRTDSGYGIAARYLVDGLCRDLDLAVFAPVGGKYKLEYYFPDLGLIGVEPSLTIAEDVEVDGAKQSRETVFDRVVPVYPGITEDLGEQIVDQHFQHFKAEVLWQIADAWALGRTVDLAKQDRIRWVLQPPVDFLDPIPQFLIDKMAPALKVVPWVQEAKERLEKAGLKNVVDPIPLGINTDLWKPQDRTAYPGAMKSLGFEYDGFNISVVAANQFGRKAWDQTFKGIRVFVEQHPEVKVRVYLHTHHQVAEGWDMEALATHLGIAEFTTIADEYTMLIGGYSENQTMMMHALADCVINAGLEGFGYSTIQAQACFPAGTNVRCDGAQTGMEHDYSGWLYEIETEKGFKCTVTAEHPFLTSAGWVKAEQLNNGSLVYVSGNHGLQDLDGGAIENIARQLRHDVCEGISQVDGSFERSGSWQNERIWIEKEDRQYHQTEGSQSFKGGPGLPCRVNRRRGHSDNPASDWPERERRIPPLSQNIQYFERNRGLVGKETSIPEHLPRSTESGEQMLHLQHSGNVVLQVFPEIRTPPNRQEEANANHASLDRKQVQGIELRRLLNLRNGTYQSNPMVECETIKTITRRYARHIAVFNLKTRDGIYFANGFLVHNCGTPVIGMNAGATKDLIETGILVPPYAETMTPNLLTKADPHPLQIMQALERVYQTPRSDFAKGADFVKRKFAWPVVIAQWKKFFEELDVELDRKCMKSGKYPPHPSGRALALSKEELVVE